MSKIALSELWQEMATSTKGNFKFNLFIHKLAYWISFFIGRRLLCIWKYISNSKYIFVFSDTVIFSQINWHCWSLFKIQIHYQIIILFEAISARKRKDIQPPKNVAQRVFHTNILHNITDVFLIVVCMPFFQGTYIFWSHYHILRVAIILEIFIQ